MFDARDGDRHPQMEAGLRLVSRTTSLPVRAHAAVLRTTTDQTATTTRTSAAARTEGRKVSRERRTRSEHGSIFRLSWGRSKKDSTSAAAAGTATSARPSVARVRPLVQMTIPEEDAAAAAAAAAGVGATSADARIRFVDQGAGMATFGSGGGGRTAFEARPQVRPHSVVVPGSMADVRRYHDAEGRYPSDNEGGVFGWHQQTLQQQHRGVRTQYTTRTTMTSSSSSNETGFRNSTNVLGARGDGNVRRTRLSDGVGGGGGGGAGFSKRSTQFNLFGDDYVDARDANGGSTTTTSGGGHGDRFATGGFVKTTTTISKSILKNNNNNGAKGSRSGSAGEFTKQLEFFDRVRSNVGDNGAIAETKFIVVDDEADEYGGGGGGGEAVAKKSSAAKKRHVSYCDTDRVYPLEKGSGKRSANDDVFISETYRARTVHRADRETATAVAAVGANRTAASTDRASTSTEVSAAFAGGAAGGVEIPRKSSADATATATTTNDFRISPSAGTGQPSSSSSSSEQYGTVAVSKNRDDGGETLCQSGGSTAHAGGGNAPATAAPEVRTSSAMTASVTFSEMTSTGSGEVERTRQQFQKVHCLL